MAATDTILALHPDRLLPVDPDTRAIARRIYDAIRELPVVSPHGHVDPRLLLDDEPFPDPATLFVTPDHYVTRLLHASGVGKALFAALPDEQIDAILKVKGLPRITPHTIVASETMWAALKVIRHRGYSFDDEEHAPGTRCVAATIYDEHAEPLGAISLAGPASRLPDERIRQLGPAVAHTAEELTRKVGGRWPHPY